MLDLLVQWSMRAGLAALFLFCLITFVRTLWLEARDGPPLHRVGLFAVLLLTALCLLMPGDHEWWAANNGPVPNLLIVHEAVRQWLVGCDLALLLALGIAGRLTRRPRLVKLALVTAIALVPVTACCAFARSPAPWYAINETRHPDGRTYAYLNSSFWQGQRLVLGRVTERYWFGTQYQGIAMTNGDSPRSWIPVIRSSSAADADPKAPSVLVAPDGRVLLLRHTNHCYIVHDPRTRETWRGGAVRTLSPFILLDARTTPRDDDVALTLRAMDEAAALNWTDLPALAERDGLSGFPPSATLELALTHENPTVRSIAQLLLQRRTKLVGAARNGEKPPAYAP